MSASVIFDSGSDATPITATSVDATSLNVAGASTLGTLSAGATTVASLVTPGNIDTASIDATNATIGTLVSNDAIVANGTVTAPDITVDAVVMPSSGTNIRMFALSPAAHRDYELPDIGVDGEIAVGTTISYMINIDNQANTTTYANITLTAVRTARTVTISFTGTGAFDGMDESSLITDSANPLPARYRPTTLTYHAMLVRSGGLQGIGYAYAAPTGRITFVGRDGAPWSGADCIIIATGFSYNV